MQDVERRKQKDEFSYLLSDLSMMFTAHSRNADKYGIKILTI
jgi:hypothetical protein